MKNLIPLPLVLGITTLVSVANAATITVNTADNTDFSAGKTNLVFAITNVSDGDTIAFNIPNTLTNKHYIATPPIEFSYTDFNAVDNCYTNIAASTTNGYPVLTANNITIDGYTQPGSSPSTSTILAANNAQIRIVLDSSNGGSTSSASSGFGVTESGILFVRGTNCHIKGLCFLGPGQGARTLLQCGGDPLEVFGIAVGDGAKNLHVSGCWFGVDLDGTTIHNMDGNVVAFGGATVNGVPNTWPDGCVIGVAAGPHDITAARAQHNVIVGGFHNLLIEGKDVRVSGNFFNVLPDGMHDLDTTIPALNVEILTEFGRGGNNMLVGTDGDGANDAEERNIYGGLVIANDDAFIEIFGTGSNPGAAHTNIVIAGNYFGVAVDGVTRFTNRMEIVNRFRRAINKEPVVQFGSDFDGVSDDIEANLISMNYPFDYFYPTPSTASPIPELFNGDGFPLISLRGNKLMGNLSPPVDPIRRNSGRGFTNYYEKYMVVDPANTNNIIPKLATNSSQVRLKGTNALGKVVVNTATGVTNTAGSYTNIIIDVYVADDEGLTNGVKFGFPQLTNGFAQGRTYLGSFLENGPLDLNPTAGEFEFDISSFGLAIGTKVTVNANYSADPMGTHRPRVHSSMFADPASLVGAIKITSVSANGSTLTINWMGALPNYSLQRRVLITDPWTTIQTGIAGTSTTDTITGDSAFYQVVGN